MKIKSVFLLFILLSTSLFATVNLELSHDIVSIDDTITLSYLVSEQAQQSLPSFSELKNDFTILSTSQSNQISIINGHIKRQYEWQIIVSPKKIGTLIIPSLKFGNEWSPSQKITVKKTISHKASKDAKDLFMTASVDIKSPYVQQQIIYKVNLYYKRPPSSGEFTLPTLENASITPLGTSKNYRTRLNNEAYNVAEQSFILIPNKSGSLVINSPIFSGTIGRKNLNDINQLLMDIQQPVKVSAPKITLNVKPIPNSYSGKTWLPAKKLTLEENFEQTATPLNQGEPLTRVIKLKALGLMANQLPELTFAPLPGAKVYPEPSVSHDESNPLNIMSEKIFKIVYLPTGDQKITLPEIKLTWWNTSNNKSEVLTLEERIFSVNLNAINAPKTPIKESSSSKSPINKIALNTPLKKPLTFQMLLPWLLVLILSLALLKKPLIKIVKPKKKKSKVPKSNDVLSAKQLQSNFKNACIKNNAPLAHQTLLALAKLKWPEAKVIQLTDIQKISNDLVFRSQIETLQQALYSTSVAWDGKDLWEAFLTLKTKSKKKEKPDVLPKFN